MGEVGLILLTREKLQQVICGLQDPIRQVTFLVLFIDNIVAEM